MRYMILLNGKPVWSYSNTRCEAIATSTRDSALAFKTREAAKKWATNYLTAYGKATIAPLGDDLLGNPVVSTNLAEVQYGPAYG